MFDVCLTNWSWKIDMEFLKSVKEKIRCIMKMNEYLNHMNKLSVERSKTLIDKIKNIKYTKCNGLNRIE